MNDNDTPIYASVQTAQKLAEMVDEVPIFIHIGEDADVIIEDEPKFLSNHLAIRKWIYNIAIALLVIVGAIQTGQAIALESWANLISLVLNLGGIGAVSVARANVR